MNIEQIEQAQKKSKELISYNMKTNQIRDFIKNLEENQSVYFQTSYQEMMWDEGKETFELIGEELIELLKKKLWEREEYLEKLDADDLIKGAEV